MARSFLTLVCNFGSVRRVQSNGRLFYVAPGTLIVPGVLNGSRGPLLYPAVEVRKSAPLWEGVEVTLGHPRTAADRTVVGAVKNVKIRNSKLIAEIWIDAKRADNADKRIIEVLQEGGKMEVSTGLLTSNEPYVGEWGGRVYKAIARNYRPDHLALLPDAVGACSLHDGCGLNVVNSTCTCGGRKMAFGKTKSTKTTKNTKSSRLATKKAKVRNKGEQLDDKQRDGLIAKIVTNSDGLYSEEDADKLGQFTDNQLLKIRQGQVDAKKKVENDGSDPTKYNKQRRAERMERDKPKMRTVGNRRRESHEDEDEDRQVTNKRRKVTNRREGEKSSTLNMKSQIKEVLRGMSAEEYFDSAPPEVQEILRESHRTYNERRDELIEVLTRNCKDDETKDALAESFSEKSIEELELLAEAYGDQRSSNPFRVNYVGNAGGRSDFTSEKDRKNFLPIPTMNWSNEEEEAVAS